MLHVFGFVAPSALKRTFATLLHRCSPGLRFTDRTWTRLQYRCLWPRLLHHCFHLLVRKLPDLPVADENKLPCPTLNVTIKAVVHCSRAVGNAAPGPTSPSRSRASACVSFSPFSLARSAASVRIAASSWVGPAVGRHWQLCMGPEGEASRLHLLNNLIPQCFKRRKTQVSRHLAALGQMWRDDIGDIDYGTRKALGS